MSSHRSTWIMLLACWLVVLLSALFTRPLLPVDETRYAAVAWEMWARGDFLVPYLNGEPYSHKPPLFFWLIHAGWWLFGVSEWVVRLVAPLLTLVLLLASTVLARQLWPRQQDLQHYLPWVLFSCVLLTAFSSWVQIDLLLVLAVVLAMTGIARAGQGRAAGWLLTGCAIGMGVLSKGPVVLMHVLPVALFAPLWKRDVHAGFWPRWYIGMLFAVLLGAVIALAWALPAAQSGGEVYRDAIFWGQTAGRMAQSFAHAHPVWWYLPWLAVLFAPWCFLPWLWSRIRQADYAGDEGLRFCLVWLIAVFVLMSMVSGKQVKYLLPLLPVFALLVTRVLCLTDNRPVSERAWLPGLVVILLGVLGVVLPLTLQKAAWINAIHPAWGALLVLLGVLVTYLKPARALQYPAFMLLVSTLVVTIAQLGTFRVAAPAYDLEAASRFVASAQADGRRVGMLKRYHGQFGFHGRLTGAIESLQADDLPQWMDAHPDGYLVVISGDATAPVDGAEFSQLYRGGVLSIVPVPALNSETYLPD